jgi:phage protein D
MFNNIRVTFPEASDVPKFIYSAYIQQDRYQHDSAVVTFYDWGTAYNDISFGSPALIEIFNLNSKKEMYGYVYNVNAKKSPGTDHVEVIIIGASMLMKEASQTVYSNITADKVVETIAKKYNFAAYTVPHPRIYPQISQAGHTDWQLMTRLAKQCGYSLRAQNTEIYFQPVLNDYTTYRSQAPSFKMNNLSDPGGSSIYSFEPITGEHTEFEDAKKATTAVSGVDKFNNQELLVINQNKIRKTRKVTKVEAFDSFATNIVAPDQETAAHEALAADNRNSFPYRAELEVIGSPDLRPDLPIYLNGIGKEYNGYWIVLSVEHSIVETERNVQTFTTKLVVGTDSLGSASSWTDGLEVLSPSPEQGRTIISGVKSTVIKPKTKLNVSTLNINAASNTYFSTIKNKPRPKVSTQDLKPPTWKTQTTFTYSNLFTEPKKQAFIQNRFKSKGGL